MIIIPSPTKVNPRRVFLQPLETNPIVGNPIVFDGSYSARANALILQNAGNCNLQIDKGFTLLPQQSVMLGNYNELNVMKIDFNITFLPATATGAPVVQQLETIEIITAIKGRGYYIDQPTN